MSTSSRRSLALLVALLLAATFLRLAAWRAAPPGLRFDEMLVVTQTAAIRDGAWPIYIDDLAEEPLYHYLFAAAQDLFGSHLFTLRWLSMTLGVISIAAIYALGRRMFDERLGLIAAALAAASFWALMYSRIGLRLIALPAFVTLAMLFLWRGLNANFRSPRRLRKFYVIAGILFGLSAYTYSATRMLPLIFAAFAAYLLVFQRAQGRSQWRNLSRLILIAIVIALPLAIHIASVPAAERRLGEVEGPLAALQRGDAQPLINSMAITAGMFITSGDPEWLYNIPNRPVFDAITGALFYLGAVMCLVRFKQAACAFSLIWLIAGLLPSMLTWPAASNSHGILAQTPAFLIAALGIDALAASLSNRVSFRGAALRRRRLAGHPRPSGAWDMAGISAPADDVAWPVSRFLAALLGNSFAHSAVPGADRRRGRRLERFCPPTQVLAAVFIGLVLVIHSGVSINDYFNRWATDPTVQIEHQAGVAATARYFGQQPAQTPLVFTSGEVTLWNPWSVTSFRLNAPIGYTNARWFDARSSFIFPQGQTDLTLIAPAQDNVPAPLDARLIEELFPIVEPSPIATGYFSATHLVSSLNTRLITLTHAAVSWPDGRAAPLPIRFDDRAELIGYDVRRSTVEVGKNIRLTTYWRAQNLGLTPISIFAHVLDDRGRLAAQWDGWTIAPEYVQRGDILVQVHFIPIPPNFAAGTYQLALGLYLPRSADLPRVPIVLDGPPVADRVLLQSIEVK